MNVLAFRPKVRSRFYPWFGHNSSACLLNENGIVAAAEEERFNRIKQSGDFPVESIRFVLDEADLSVADIDEVAVTRDPMLDNKRLQPRHTEDLLPSSAEDAYVLFQHTAVRLANHLDRPRTDISNAFADEFNEHIDDKITYVPHHRCHAASAFYCSDFDDQVTITLDASGEYDSTVLWDEQLDRVKTFSNENSLGIFYNVGTEYLGFRPNRDAGKVMGLASYGNYREEFDEAFKEITTVEYGGYDVSELMEHGTDLLEEFFGEKRVYPEEITQRHKDFAYHLQLRLEEIVTSLVRSHVEQTGCGTVALAGGVAMNCKLNREVKNLDCVEDLFIQPAANDSGLCLGAALDVGNRRRGHTPDFDFDNVYLGSAYQNEEIASILDRAKLDYERTDEIAKRTAKLLDDGYLVGWFQGRMEFGARALGNRSILANPSSQEYKDKVNLNVKDRENWRPFAPSILYEDREEYLVDGDESPYMILLDEIKEEKQDQVAAITHTDGTCRPQTVRKQTNERYHTLISEFKKLSGLPVVLNTSFNTSGEPIVESPQQAISDFASTGLDALAIGEYLLTKPTVDL